MNEQEVLDLINQFIVANGNNEITADVLRPILEAMVSQPNILIGTLSQLQTSDQSNLVAAINEVYGMIGTITDLGVQLHEGTADPNITPPTEYNIADFYIQKDLSNNPIQLWQYNGVSWIASFQTSENDFHADISYTGSSNFIIPSNLKGISVFLNKSFLYNSEYTRTTPTNVFVGGTLETGDTISIVGTLL